MQQSRSRYVGAEADSTESLTADVVVAGRSRAPSNRRPPPTTIEALEAESVEAVEAASPLKAEPPPLKQQQHLQQGPQRPSGNERLYEGEV